MFTGSEYPHTDFNKINLDWICDELKADKEQIEQNTADIEELKAGGTVTDYEDLQNLPKLNGVTLVGNKSLENVGAASADEVSELKSALSVVTPEMFGAVGDGVADDSGAIKDALSYAVNNNVTLKFLEATYNIGTHSPSNFNIHITGSCNIVGSGKDKTIIKSLGDNAGLVHLLNIDNANNVYISNLTLDGGINPNSPIYTDNVYCSGIRIDTSNNISIENVAIRNMSGYGISVAAGSVTHFYLNNIDVENTGRDGIDAKNFNDTNGDFKFSNIYVSNPGMRNAVGSGVGADQVCIDIRCKTALVNNCYFEHIKNAAGGLRARITTTSQGTGGEYCNFSNIAVIGEGGNTGEGIVINAEGVNVNNFYVEKMGVGVRVTKDNVSLSNGKIRGTTNGGIRLDADGLMVINCYLSECGINGGISMLDMRAGNSIHVNCVYGDCDTVSGCYNETVGIYFTSCYLKGTTSTRFAAGSYANRTTKNHINSTCINITIN